MSQLAKNRNRPNWILHLKYTLKHTQPHIHTHTHTHTHGVSTKADIEYNDNWVFRTEIKRKCKKPKKPSAQ